MSADAQDRDESELRGWLRLVGTPGVGGETARRLLKAFASPQAIFDASLAALRGVVGSGPVATALTQTPPWLEQRTRETLAWLDDDPHGRRRWIALGDPAFPASLLNTADPPSLLFLQGRFELLACASIAIVGSRNATSQGADNARSFASHLSKQSITIISGLASGIDAAAHEGGLDGEGSTVAVVGTGLDTVYPRGNLALAHRIAAQGLLVSELPLGTPPLPSNFPRRNRIIAGLALGTLVVEAAPQSGSLITARLAAEAGREVFAIPGSIHSPQARGCHQLIKQGAKLVETADDILSELSIGRSAPATAISEPAADAPHDDLLEGLGFDPTTLDALSARTGWPAHELNARLLELELLGIVARLPGGLYQRVSLA